MVTPSEVLAALCFYLKAHKRRSPPNKRTAKCQRESKTQPRANRAVCLKDGVVRQNADPGWKVKNESKELLERWRLLLGRIAVTSTRGRAADVSHRQFAPLLTARKAAGRAGCGTGPRGARAAAALLRNRRAPNKSRTFYPPP